MLDKYYCLLVSKIEPSEELINQTKSKMYAKLDQQPTPLSKRLYQFGTIAACIILVTGFLLTPLIKNQLNENRNLQLGLNTNADEHKNSSRYSNIESNLDIENNPDNGEIAETDQANNPKSDPTLILKLAQQEAYSFEEYGQFLPRSILSGYKFEAASINNNAAHKILNLIYTSGYYYIEIRVRTVQPEDENRMVKVNEIEKYDITKYTIPFADSIPPNFYYTMRNPIFQSEELTKEVLSLRKITTHEQGDDCGGETMRFAIQCGKFLIEYNIKGNSLNGVFDMVTSSDYFTK